MVQPVSQAALDAIPVSTIHQASFWLNQFSEDWRSEVPMRLHEKGVFGLGSSPPFAPEFVGYVGKLECKVPGCRECADLDRPPDQNNHRPRRQNPDNRLRTTRAFRKLRKAAPREFDVLYLYCVIQLSIPAIAKALNERAIRLEKPERYDPVGVILLMLAGVDKVMKWW